MTDVGAMVDNTGGTSNPELVAAINALSDCEQVRPGLGNRSGHQDRHHC
jgi:hypothetical protein